MRGNRASDHRRRYRAIAQVDASMLANAKDYIERSVEAYQESEYKVALIFLWSGLLLFMKLRLFRIRPVLIYQSTSDVIGFDPATHMPVYREFDTSGDRKTVSYREIKDRLRELSVETAISQYDQVLSSLQRFRNRVEHYINDVTQADYIRSIDCVLPFLTAFVENELHEDLSELIDNWDQLLAIEAFYRDRVARMADGLEERQYHAAADGDDLHTTACPRCPDGTMTDEGDEMVCGACAFHSAYRVCTRCGAAVLEEEWSRLFEETGVCDECFDRLTERE